MKVLLALCAIVAVAAALPVVSEETEPSKPYSFNYVAENEEGGSSSRTETSDETGTVRGSYTITDVDGRSRVVEYVAGVDGFQANIRTNEPGADNSAPAHVSIDFNAEQAKAIQLSAPVRHEVVKPVVAHQNVRSSDHHQNVRSSDHHQNVRYVMVPATEPEASPAS
ncbi:hypothetical protein CEXT_789621 [Caerostris extrusa]|uniref:Uncharacterized protein n=1 Tax=Caerostris extrusa TaxID=172846 RepID=A0AAV4PSX2_CAEEX|nr:hypothetical protein CEXT_789621 [Caerostris extrusa]